MGDGAGNDGLPAKAGSCPQRSCKNVTALCAGLCFNTEIRLGKPSRLSDTLSQGLTVTLCVDFLDTAADISRARTIPRTLRVDFLKGKPFSHLRLGTVMASIPNDNVQGSFV